MSLLLQAGLVATSCGLGILSLLLTALTWGAFPPRETTAALAIDVTARVAGRRPI